MKNLIFIFILTISTISCTTGELGPQGPIGEQGPKGTQGINNTVTGPTGDDGAVGDKGATGASGDNGKDGISGVGNLIVSSWKLTNWTYRDTKNGNETYFIGEIDMPEITQDVLDKGLVTVYVRVNNGTTGFFELNQGVLYTVGSFELKLNGIKKGKVLLIHQNSSEISNESVTQGLNSLSLQSKVSIIKPQ